MDRRIPALALILAAACGGRIGWIDLGGKSAALSHAQYASLERGLRAQWIVKAFGPPAHRLEKEGKVRGLTYRCEDARGEVGELRMVFGPEERLERWSLGGSPGAVPTPHAPGADGAPAKAASKAENP